MLVLQVAVKLAELLVLSSEGSVGLDEPINYGFLFGDVEIGVAPFSKELVGGNLYVLLERDEDLDQLFLEAGGVEYVVVAGVGEEGAGGEFGLGVKEGDIFIVLH